MSFLFSKIIYHIIKSLFLKKRLLITLPSISNVIKKLNQIALKLFGSKLFIKSNHQLALAILKIDKCAKCKII